MDGHIDLDDHTARTLERLQALTGRPVASILDDALSAELARVEQEALRAIIQAGVDAADAGRFSTKTVEELFEVAVGRAATNNQDR